MEPLQQEIHLTFGYQVYFTTDVFASENPLFKDVLSRGGTVRPQKLLAVVDRGVLQHHPDLLDRLEAYAAQHRTHLALAAPPVVLAGGEGVKNNPEYVDILHQAIHRAGLCRHSYVVAIGGGAVIDAAGFAAATAHRGVRLLRVPTTVMAQADASVGVKNSVNAFGQKNFLGTFAPPYAVINDSRFLTTLSSRDWISGVAEAVKVAVIKDAAFFGFLELHAAALAGRDLALMQQVIRRCAALHLEHIATGGDPFESGSSRPLDFGHWAAHRLEHLSGYALRHGEAVAIGVALDSTYACLAGLLPVFDWRRLLDTLMHLGFRLYVPELHDPRLIPQGLDEFREHLGGRLTITLPLNLGRSLEVHEMDLALINQSISLLCRQAAKTPRG
jgi:3-dehydroquinate synthase